jgi:hypothetical protein
MRCYGEAFQLSTIIGFFESLEIAIRKQIIAAGAVAREKTAFLKFQNIATKESFSAVRKTQS